MRPRRPPSRAGGRRSGFACYGPSPGSWNKAGHHELDAPHAGPPLFPWFWWDPSNLGAVMSGAPLVYESIPNPGTLGGYCSAGAGSRPTVAALDVAGVSRPVGYFDDTNDLHDHSAAAAAWAPLHQACTVFGVLRPWDANASYALCTTDAAGANTGLAIYTISQRLEVRACNGSGAYLVNANSGANTVPTLDITTFGFRMSAADGYEILIDGASMASGALVGAPSVGPPAAPGRVGSGIATAPFYGDVCEILAWPRRLSDLEMALVSAYLTGRWLPSNVWELQGFDLLLDAALGVTLDPGNPQAGNQAAAWASQTGGPVYLQQPTDADQYTLNASDAGLDNEPSLESFGADWMELVGSVGPGTSHVFHLVWDNDTDVGSLNLFDSQTGRLIIQNNTDVRIWDGAVKSLGPILTGPQVQTFLLNAAGNRSDHRRNGYFVGSNTFTGVAIGGATALGAFYNGSGNWIDGRWALVAHRDSMPTVAELWAENEALYARNPGAWMHEATGEPCAALVVPAAIGAGLIDREAYMNAAAGNVELSGSDVVAWRDLSVSRAELLTNGDCESLTGWTAWAGATLSLKSASPYEGTYNIRATDADVGGVYQNILTNGKAYRVRGAVRGDSVGVGKLSAFGAVQGVDAVGSWTWVDAVGVPSGVTTVLAHKDAAGAWCECDGMSTIRCCDAIQPTAANRPTYVANVLGSGKPGLNFSAAGLQYLITALDPSTMAVGSILVEFTLANVGATSKALVNQYDTPTARACLLNINSSAQLVCRFGAVPATVTDANALLANRIYRGCMTWNTAGLIKLYSDRTGTMQLQGSVAPNSTPTARPLYIGVSNASAGLSGHHDGHILAWRQLAWELQSAADVARAFTLMDLDLI